MRVHATIFAAVFTSSISAAASASADPEIGGGGIRGSPNSGENGGIDLLASYPEVAKKFEDGVHRFYERVTTTPDGRRHVLEELLSQTSAGTAAAADADTNGRNLLSEACVSTTDAIYEAIDSEVKALFDSKGSCGPQMSYLPAITATINHNDCSPQVLQNHTEACSAVNGTTIVANLKAECKINGMIPFIPVTAYFVGEELNICMSNDQCNKAEVAAIDEEAATGLMDLFKGDISEGFGLDFDMDCKVQSVEQVAVKAATNSTRI